MNSKVLALPLRKVAALNHGDQPIGSRLFNVRDANNNAVAHHLEEYEANELVKCCNLHGQLLGALKLARGNIDAWIGAMHDHIDCNDDVDLLEKIDALIAEASR